MVVLRWNKVAVLLRKETKRESSEYILIELMLQLERSFPPGCTVKPFTTHLFYKWTQNNVSLHSRGGLSLLHHPFCELNKNPWKSRIVCMLYSRLASNVEIKLASARGLCGDVINIYI